MSLQAIIMAGGEGARLRPLTCDLPKPMVPVLGQPVMRYALQLLRKHGFTEIGATVHYLSDVIMRHFEDGKADRVNLRYFQEEKPVGTAGSIKMAESSLQETFLVLSGDGLTDCDLRAALQFHRRRGALATMVLKRVPCPLSYGVVVTDETGRVTRFVEKPGWDEACSDTVNTGIYILEPEVLRHIPTDGPYDFGSQLFPLLVSQKQPVYGYIMNSYWCDIGDITAYMQAQADFLQGRIALDADAQPDRRGIWLAGDAKISPDADIRGPVYIGNHVSIGAGVHISECSVLGDGVMIAEGASVKHSVLWPDAFVGPKAQIRGITMGIGARVEESATAFEDAVIGDHAILGAQARLDPGVKVWPCKQVEPGMRVATNLVWGNLARPRVDAQGAEATSPAWACTLSGAWAHASGAKEMALLHADDAVSESLAAAALGGLMAQGVQVTHLGVGNLPVLRRMQRMLRIPAGIFVAKDKLVMTGALGIPPSRDMQRRVETLAQRQDFPRPYKTETLTPLQLGDSTGFYAGALAADWDLPLLRDMQPHAALFVQDAQQARAAQQVLRAAQLENVRVVQGEAENLQPWETGFTLDVTGETLTVFDAQGTPGESEQLLLRCQALLDDGAKVLLAPVDAPRTLESLAGAAEARVRRVRTSYEAFMQALPQALPETLALRQLDVHFDGLAAMLSILQMLVRHRTTLRNALDKQPQVFRRTATVPCSFPDKGRILRELAAQERFPDMTDGMRVDYGRGWALLLPLSGRPEFRILGEAQDAEFADELCAKFEQRIRALQENATSAEDAPNEQSPEKP